MRGSATVRCSAPTNSERSCAFPNVFRVLGGEVIAAIGGQTMNDEPIDEAFEAPLHRALRTMPSLQTVPDHALPG